jgi:catechol 2,3-dioxygenase-like lactoylglutathione lyase family enzyme
MPQIRGVGGVFLHADDPRRLAEWYTDHFGLAFASDVPATYYTELFFRDDDDTAQRRSIVFAIMPAQTARTPMGERGEYTINYRVDDLRAFATELEAHGVSVEVIQEQHDGRYPGSKGLFAHLRDGEGNRIELYQPL